MTEPSQYFKGRTVQEQMNEVIGYVDVRSAEVATNAIAADVAQVHQDMLDADADAAAAAASAAAAAGTLANAVKKTGEASQSIAGNIAVAGDLSAGGDLAVAGDATAVNIISTGTLYANNDASVGRNLGVGGSTSVVDLTATGNVSVPTPTGNNYAANKKYVDDADALKVSITNINSYAVGLTGNQGPIAGAKTFSENITLINDKSFNRKTSFDWSNNPSTDQVKAYNEITDVNGTRIYIEQLYEGANGTRGKEFILYNQNNQNIRLILSFGTDGKGKLAFRNTSGATHVIYQET